VVASVQHAFLVELLAERADLLVELLRRARLAEIPDGGTAEARSASFTELVPPEYAADGVVAIRTPAGDDACLFVLEVLLGHVSRKRQVLPLYVASAFAKWQRPVQLVILTLDRTSEQRARAPIVVGPGMVLHPLVLGPSSIPCVHDAAEAQGFPELAVLSALAHADTPRGPEVAAAALLAARGLDDPRSRLYVDLVLKALPAAAHRTLEALMRTQGYEFQSEFAKRYIALGREEGREEGLAAALLRVLEARGWAVDTESAARIRACRDEARLSKWLQRAVTAPSLDEVWD
jgi:hypothetical protein